MYLERLVAPAIAPLYDLHSLVPRSCPCSFSSLAVLQAMESWASLTTACDEKLGNTHVRNVNRDIPFFTWLIGFTT